MIRYVLHQYGFLLFIVGECDCRMRIHFSPSRTNIIFMLELFPGSYKFAD